SQPRGLIVGKDLLAATVLYGTTQGGGPNPCGSVTGLRGTLFKIDFPAGVPTFSELNCFGFQSADGGITTIAGPNLPMQASDMKLYGSSAGREVWMIDFSTMGSAIPATALAAFDAGTPVGPLVEGSDAALYGVQQDGGSGSKGSVFRVDLS